jgi:hypothetical protein
MTSIADFVSALHDIDAAKGRVCRDCAQGWTIRAGYGDAQRCRKGYAPAGPGDGCDDWVVRQGRQQPAERRGGPSAGEAAE